MHLLNSVINKIFVSFLKFCGSALCGVLPIFFVAAVIFATSPSSAAKRKVKAKSAAIAKTVGRPAVKPPVGFTSIWLESFNFFVEEQDDESIGRLIQDTVLEPVDNPEITDRIFRHYLESKNRSGLLTYAQALNRSGHCFQNESSSQCRKLAVLWRSNLDSVLFFEASAGALVKARNALTAKDCPTASALLQDVESKEGDPLPVLQILLDVYQCLGNTAAIQISRQKISEIESIGVLKTP